MSVLISASRRVVGALALVTFAVAPARLAAQSAAEHVALGDREYQALNAPAALRHYEEALKVDPRCHPG